MRVDDFIVFGRTVPEDSKRYGTRVCMAGYSEEMRQMMRVYPTDVESNIKARRVLKLELERNKMDSRAESWALKDRTMKSILAMSEPVNKEILKPFLKKEAAESIDYLNKNRRSLGVLIPETFEVIIKTRKHIDDPEQLLLFDDFAQSGGFKTASDYFLAPYLKTNKGCFQIREWGVYELLRKYENERKKITASDITSALHIEDDKEVFLVVGNMNHIRTAWLIIKTFSFVKDTQISLLDIAS